MKKTKKTTKTTIQRRVTIWFCIFAVLLSAATGIFTYITYKDSVEQMYAERSTNSAETVAHLISGDRVKQYASTLTKDDYYQREYVFLQQIKEDQNINNLYVIIPGEEKVTYVFDIYLADEDTSLACDLGHFDYYGDQEEADYVLDIFKQNVSNENIMITESKYGYLATSYAHVLDSSGNVCALVGVDISMDSILSQVDNYVVFAIIAIFALILIFLLLLLIVLRKTIVLPVKSLTNRVELFIKSGEKIEFEKLRIETGDEIETLSEAFNKMSEDLHNYIDNLSKATAEKEKMKTELDVAKKLQMSILPRTFPAYPNRSEFDIYAFMTAARQVGGDFYDLFLVGEDKLAVVIADVSGKGVPAALLMMSTRALVKNQVMISEDFSTVFNIVNNQICEDNDTGMFVTAFLGLLDLKTGEFYYTNAGHNPPLIKRNDGTFEWMDVKRNFVLGGFPNIKYSTGRIMLGKGDTIFMYTDGVTEATNQKEELYSAERLQRELKASSVRKGASPKDHIEYIMQSIEAFSTGAEQADDITMLSFRYFGEQ